MQQVGLMIEIRNGEKGLYAYIEGILAEKNENELVIETSGVAYSIQCANNVVSAAPAIGETMRCYTYLSVREDAMELFGFASRKEKEMFLRLRTVSGIGPKTALGILGSMSLQELGLAIAMEDIAMLSRAPGVGKKTAQRIALELKDKVPQMDVEGIFAENKALEGIGAEGSAFGDALLALQSLGYSSIEATKALQKVKNQSTQTDELIRLALRGMAGQ